MGQVWDWYGIGMGRDRELDNKILDSTCLDLALDKPNMICRTDKTSIFSKLFDYNIYNRDTISNSHLTNRSIPV